MSGIAALSVFSSIDDERLRHSWSTASFPYFVLFRNNAALSFEAGRHLSAMLRPVFLFSPVRCGPFLVWTLSNFTNFSN
jgi:hypothetical protein